MDKQQITVKQMAESRRYCIQKYYSMPVPPDLGIPSWEAFITCYRKLEMELRNAYTYTDTWTSLQNSPEFVTFMAKNYQQRIVLAVAFMRNILSMDELRSKKSKIKAVLSDYFTDKDDVDFILCEWFTIWDLRAKHMADNIT